MLSRRGRGGGRRSSFRALSAACDVGGARALATAVSPLRRLQTRDTLGRQRGLDALKRGVGEIRDTTQQGVPGRVASDRAYNALKEQAPSQGF